MHPLAVRTLFILALVLPTTAFAVEPDPPGPLSRAELREIGEQHVYTYKMCLRRAFGVAPTRLIITLTVGPPEDRPPSLPPILRGDGTPDPWLRSSAIEIEPTPTPELRSCIRDPLEYFFRNVSLNYETPRRRWGVVLDWKDLNARPESAQKRVAAARAAIESRMDHRDQNLDRCLTTSAAPRIEGTLDMMVRKNGAIDLIALRTEDHRLPGLVPCLAAQLGLTNRGIEDQDTEPLTLPITLTKPPDPEPDRSIQDLIGDEPDFQN